MHVYNLECQHNLNLLSNAIYFLSKRYNLVFWIIVLLTRPESSQRFKQLKIQKLFLSLYIIIITLVRIHILDMNCDVPERIRVIIGLRREKRSRVKVSPELILGGQEEIEQEIARQSKIYLYQTSIFTLGMQQLVEHIRLL